MQEIKVYIEVKGGMVWAVYADAPRNIRIVPVVMDYDVSEDKELEELLKLEAEVKGMENIYC